MEEMGFIQLNPDQTVRSLPWVSEVVHPSFGGSEIAKNFRFVASRGWRNVKKDGGRGDPNIVLPFTKCDRLAEAVFFRLQVAGKNSILSVFRTDAVEEEISKYDFIFGTVTESDSAAVTQAVV